MDTLIVLSIISLIYTIGFWIALYISVYIINKEKSHMHPMFSAMFSWLFVFISILFVMVKIIFKK